MVKDEIKIEFSPGRPRPSRFTPDKFALVLKDTIAKIENLIATKGEEYKRSDDDQLSNFRRAGAELDVPMELVWLVYAGKHWDALSTYIKDLKDQRVRTVSEPISGRVDDLIVYLILLRCMIVERESK